MGEGITARSMSLVRIRPAGPPLMTQTPEQQTSISFLMKTIKTSTATTLLGCIGRTFFYIKDIMISLLEYEAYLLLDREE